MLYVMLLYLHASTATHITQISSWAFIHQANAAQTIANQSESMSQMLYTQSSSSKVKKWN